MKIKITQNGPYEVKGSVPLIEEDIVSDKNGDPLKWKKIKDFPKNKKYLLCRCGKSKTKPYCDYSHLGFKFNGAESKDAKKKFSELDNVYIGPKINLHDADKLCAGAGFCHRKGGTWKLAETDSQNAKKLAISQSCNCPSGRLVAEGKSGKKIEPKLNKEISVTQEPDAGVSGPYWVKGKIPIESENGYKFESRNRVTLCRCGQSNNKPFCDGMHHYVKFKDN